MKYTTSIALFFLFIGCVNSNSVFWCGDHACKNNKEKEAYFAKTGIVEIKQKNKRSKKKLSKIEIVEKEYGLNQEEGEEKRIENKKISKIKQNSQKNQLEIEKEIERQIARDEKNRLREEEEKIKDKKKLSKKNNDGQGSNTFDCKDSDTACENKSTEFDDLAKSIIEKNKTKSYPDINDIN